MAIWIGLAVFLVVIITIVFSCLVASSRADDQQEEMFADWQRTHKNQ